jgi:hypothetical protein
LMISGQPVSTSAKRLNSKLENDNFLMFMIVSS